MVVCFTVALASVASILRSTGGCFGIAGDSGGASSACAGSHGASARASSAQFMGGGGISTTATLRRVRRALVLLLLVGRALVVRRGAYAWAVERAAARAQRRLRRLCPLVRGMVDVQGVSAIVFFFFS